MGMVEIPIRFPQPASFISSVSKIIRNLRNPDLQQKDKTEENIP
jgi:hypothetical protein